MTQPDLVSNVAYHLGRIYEGKSAAEIDVLAERVIESAGLDAADPLTSQQLLPGADEVVLITYADTVRNGDDPHLQSLGAFWRQAFAQVFSTLHVLPFFPSSSDGGFSVVDYHSVDPRFGDWNDLAALVGEGRLMVDLVCNHGSAQSAWFAQFLADETPGRDYYLTADPQQDLSGVTRPRTHPLLLPVDTPAGKRHVWATFSHDQVDFDFANPDVLIEFCSILGHYVSQGATRVRLDAIAYLWKQVGTTCVHLPQTHQVVKLMRTLLAARAPGSLLITETNVPHRQNVSYFGTSDEAQMVYNFTLAPLIAWSLVVGQAQTLTSWLGQLDSPPAGCTFFNFIASHDGIGLRPVEDLISPQDLQPLIDAATSVGGDYSAYSAPGGPRPYELNVSLADLLAGSDGETAQRFVVAHAVMLAVQGVPGVYIHSMLATPGDHDAVAQTGHKRDINRATISLEHARTRLDQEGGGWRAQAFNALAELISVRRQQPAFAPTARQTVHVVHPSVLAVERGGGDDAVMALHNLSGDTVEIELPAGSGRNDLITGGVFSNDTHLTLAPWQAVWLGG